MIDRFKSITCQRLDKAELQEILTEELAIGAYRPLGADPKIIKLNFGSRLADDILMSVYSHRAGAAPLYHGKVVGAIEVFPGQELFEDNGADNLSFKFFNLESMEICSQMQDGGAVYWQPGKTIRIEFLSEKELDPDVGTPIGHRVHLE